MKKILLIIVSIVYMNIAFANLDEIFGNAGNGDQCKSDYQCESLCCDQTKGICNPHEPTAKNPIFCSKQVGEQCLTSEFCKAESVRTCKLVKVILNTSGQESCALRCAYVETRGSCVNGSCQAPKTPPVPSYDPSNPDCSNVVDP